MDAITALAQNGLDPLLAQGVNAIVVLLNDDNNYVLAKRIAASVPGIDVVLCDNKDDKYLMNTEGSGPFEQDTARIDGFPIVAPAAGFNTSRKVLSLLSFQLCCHAFPPPLPLLHQNPPISPNSLPLLTCVYGLSRSSLETRVSGASMLVS